MRPPNNREYKKACHAVVTAHAIQVLESNMYLSVTVDPGRLLALGSSARLAAASRTPVLGTVVRRRGGDAVEVQRGRCRPAGGDDVVGGHIPSLAALL